MQRKYTETKLSLFGAEQCDWWNTVCRCAVPLDTPCPNSPPFRLGLLDFRVKSAHPSTHSSSSSILLLVNVVSSSSPARRTDHKWPFHCRRPQMHKKIHSRFSCFEFSPKQIWGVLQWLVVIGAFSFGSQCIPIHVRQQNTYILKNFFMLNLTGS